MMSEKFVLINLVHKSVLEHQNSKEFLRPCSLAVSGLRGNRTRGEAAFPGLGGSLEACGMGTDSDSVLGQYNGFSVCCVSVSPHRAPPQ